MADTKSESTCIPPRHFSAIIKHVMYASWKDRRDCTYGDDDGMMLLLLLLLFVISEAEAEEEEVTSDMNLSKYVMPITAISLSIEHASTMS